MGGQVTNAKPRNRHRKIYGQYKGTDPANQIG